MGAVAVPAPEAGGTSTATTTSQHFISTSSSIYSAAQAAGISLVLLALLLLSFAGAMRWRRGARALAPRRGQSRPMAFPLGWLQESWRDRAAARRGASQGEEFFRRDAGGGHGLTADAEVLVRFCELGFKFSSLFLLVGLVLIPLYASGHGGIDASGLDRYSASNFSAEDRTKFWVVIIAAYLMTGLFGYLVHGEWKHFMRMRRAHLMRVARGTNGRAAAQAQYSVIVEDVPLEQRSTACVRAFFENLFGANGVRACVPQGATQNIYRVADLDGTARALTRRCFNRRSGLSRALMSIDADSLVQRARADMAQGRPGAGGTSTAFVTFRSVRDRVVAEQLAMSPSGGWLVSGAPEARDIVWRNAATASDLVKFRHLVGVAGTVALSVFWSVPVCALMAFASVEHLERWLPGGEGSVPLHERHPFAYSLASNYMNVIILTSLFALLPQALETMATQFEGHKSKSMIQRIVLMRYISYQLATLYVIVIASQPFATLTAIMNHPIDIFKVLQSTIPTKSVYFTTLVCWRIGMSLPLLLLRPGAVTSLCMGEDGNPPRVPCAFAWEAGDISLIVVLMLTYAVISPVILPACAVYFGLGSLVYRWLFANVYTPEFDSGGAFWYELFDGAVLGLLLGTLTLAAWAYKYMEGMNLQFYAVVLLPILVVCHWIFCQRRFGGPSKTMSFEDATAIDRGSSIVAFFSDDCYLDPVLKNNSGDAGGHAPLSVSFVSSNLDEVSMDTMSTSLHSADISGVSSELEADSSPRTSWVASAPS